jgi:biopolymer transport protein ExbB
LAEIWNANWDFLEAGGEVLVAILFVTFLMWTLIAERYWYLRRAQGKTAARVIDQWRARADRSSWHARQIRQALISRVSRELNRTIPTIKTLVALCPLLGLLGTVTGMIQVFDVMAIAGSGNPRAMASGVSRATIPTMAGMVAALSGFVFTVPLQRRAQREAGRVADRLAPGPEERTS